MTAWKKIDSQLILNTQFFKVRNDIVELPTGERKDWIYWDSIDSAMVIGITKDKKIVMIKQYRYLVHEDVIEFPSGSLEKGESPEEAAVREFEEESGYSCKNLIKLGSYYETYGQLNRQIHIFFSKDITKTKQNLDSKGTGYEDIKVQLIDFDEALQLALNNKIVAMGSTLAMILLNEKISQKEISLK